LETRARTFSLGIKDLLDQVFAVVLLLLTSPVLAGIAAAIRLDSPGHPLFFQERIGKNGRPFTIIKFRTMRVGSENEGLGVTTASDDERITGLGRVLRATGLDELPQLLNIARGEMSFIGPRPTLRPQVEAYTPRQRRRLLLRPGITGWAQVNGRNSISWAERIELDIDYVDHYSLWMDAKVLWRTLIVLIRQDDVYSAEGANDIFVPESSVREATIGGTPTPASLGAETVASAPRGRAAGDPQNSLVVIGAGGHASVVIDAIEKGGLYRVAGLIDDGIDEPAGGLFDYPLLGGEEALAQPGLPRRAVVAIGAAPARRRWLLRLEALGFDLPSIVHPFAQVGRGVQLGAGTVLLAGTIVNPRTRIGRGVIINTGASVDHDCEIGDFVHIAPGARIAGGVRIDSRAHIGIGACVIQCVTIGADAVIGAGAAVVSSIAADVTAVGVPARPIRHRDRSISPSSALG
jgi:sugar O-acyltransferase (sialic acid O-acetyltransferase NeuD family)